MKIVVVDDHPLVREGLSAVLSLQEDIEITGKAADVSQGVALIKNNHPDLALIDLRLSNRESGLDIIEKTKGESCKYIVLTSSAEDRDFKKANEAGAHGYVLKEALPEELLTAVRLVYKGRKYYDPGLLELIMNNQKYDELKDLTQRELEVLEQLGHGYSNKEIAKKLYITEYTVKKHVSQILAKLELNDRTQAALFAQNKNIV